MKRFSVGKAEKAAPVKKETLCRAMILPDWATRTNANFIPASTSQACVEQAISTTFTFDTFSTFC